MRNRPDTTHSQPQIRNKAGRSALTTFIKTMLQILVSALNKEKEHIQIRKKETNCH